MTMDYPTVPVKVVTTGATAVSVDPGAYKTEIITGGTAASEDFNLGDGTGVEIGTRRLVYLKTLSDASDVINLDHANCVNVSGTQYTNLDLDAADEFLLTEWNGAKWQTIYVSGTEAT